MPWGFQTPCEEVFGPQKHAQNTFSGYIWNMYGIFTYIYYIWLIFPANLGKYNSPMDPMG